MAVRAIDREKCNGCGRCVQVCPMDVFGQLGKFVFLAYPADCMTCFLCELECPRDAVEVGPERAVPKVFPY